VRRKTIEPDERLLRTEWAPHQLAVQRALREERPLFHARTAGGETLDLTPDLVAARSAANRTRGAKVYELRGRSQVRIYG
jgi:hypothetical protein